MMGNHYNNNNNGGNAISRNNINSSSSDASSSASAVPPRTLFSLEGIHPLAPTLSYAIEAANPSQARVLTEALARLQKEDPSFRVAINEQAQVVVSGMGELHLEIIMSRLEREYDLQCRLLRAIVEYHEVLVKRRTFRNQVISHNGLPLFSLDFEVFPLVRETNGGDGCGVDDDVKIIVSQPVQNAYLSHQNTQSQLAVASGRRNAKDGEEDEDDDIIKRDDTNEANNIHDVTYEEPDKHKRRHLREVITALDQGLKEAARVGPLACLPLHGFNIIITKLMRKGASPGDHATITAGSRGFFTHLFREHYNIASENAKFSEEVQLLEPMVELEISLIDPDHTGGIMSLLSEKGAVEVDLEDEHTIRALCPMRNVTRFTTDLRKATRGNAYYSCRLRSHRLIEQEDVRKRILANKGVAQ